MHGAEKTAPCRPSKPTAEFRRNMESHRCFRSYKLTSILIGKRCFRRQSCLMIPIFGGLKSLYEKNSLTSPAAGDFRDIAPCPAKDRTSFAGDHFRKPYDRGLPCADRNQGRR